MFIAFFLRYGLTCITLAGLINLRPPQPPKIETSRGYHYTKLFNKSRELLNRKGQKCCVVEMEDVSSHGMVEMVTTLL